MPPAKKRAKKSAEKFYVISDDSELDNVTVDDKHFEHGMKPVALTQDQFDRVSALEGFKLIETAREE